MGMREVLCKLSRSMAIAGSHWRVDAPPIGNGQTGTMVAMQFRRNALFASLATAVLLAAGLTLSAQDSSHRGRKYKAPTPTARIEVTILRDADAKPVENASVIFHLDGDKGNMELKTNEDGKTMIDVLPIGSTMRLQVIAKGFQTYGEDFKIDKAEMAFGIKLKRPGEQYSIYKKHDETADAGMTPDAKSTDKGKADAAKDTAPKDSAKPPQPQPDTTQPQPH